MKLAETSRPIGGFLGLELPTYRLTTQVPQIMGVHDERLPFANARSALANLIGALRDGATRATLSDERRHGVRSFR
jgi:hypothetical protein